MNTRWSFNTDTGDGTMLNRRTLRPTLSHSRAPHAPAGSDLLSHELIEGAILWRHPGAEVTIEIAGGPPFAVLTVVVAGRAEQTLKLDACGCGTAELRIGSAGLTIEVLHADRVVLAGRPSAYEQVARPGRGVGQ